MKLNLSICILLACNGIALAATAAPGEDFLDGRADLSANAKMDAAAVCGNLGVNDEIPEGADRSKYGLCKHHPLGHTSPLVTLSNATERAVLEKRQCWHEEAYGCSSGYCWTRCGADWSFGYWCWMSTAANNRKWVVCSVKGQCGGWEPRHCSDGCSC